MANRLIYIKGGSRGKGSAAQRMKDQLQKRYGLPMAIAMVVGIVIGSGVFFKAETVLKATGGDVLTGILAWAIVGVVMMICAYTFSIMASRYEKVNGVVDYAEVMVGPRYGYYMGWFMTFIYQPAITSVLAAANAARRLYPGAAAQGRRAHPPAV